MKTVTLLSLLSVLLAVGQADYRGYTQGHNGRPACKTAEEMTRPWKNNFDPTKYFICVTQGQPGVQLQCPSFSGFMDSPPIFGCVNWGDYVALPPYDPPSLAPNNGNGNGGCGGGSGCSS